MALVYPISQFYLCTELKILLLWTLLIVFYRFFLLISHPTVVAKSLFWSIAIVLALIIINSLAGIVITSVN